MDDVPFFERVRVAVRERPITEDDLSKVRLHVKVDEDKLVAFAPGASEGLMYDSDYYFPCNTTQNDIYLTIGKEMVDLAIKGVSCNVVTTGYTDTGKTYTLYGDVSNTGLIQDTVKDLYQRLEAQSDEYDTDILLRYWEMSRDAVEDNLRGDNEETKESQYMVSRDNLDRLTIPNLTTVEVQTFDEFMAQLNRGNVQRIQRSYNRMSRWHGFVQLIITTTDKAERSRNLIRTMTFVHMKGTDRVGAKGMRGELLKEGSCINVSVTLLCAAIIHSLEYREKRKLWVTTPEKHRDLIRRSQSFFMECKFSRLMSQLICGFEASFIIGCISPLNYNESIETLESLQLFRRLKCEIKPMVLISDRGVLLQKLRQHETVLGEDNVEELYNSDIAGKPLTEAEEKLLILYGKLYGADPRKGADKVFTTPDDSTIIERSKSRARRESGKVETHGLRKRIFLNSSKTATYEGQWEDGRFGGFGELIQKRLKYRGEFRNGLREGEGTLWVRTDEKSPWVRVYRGEWLAGKRDGFGTSWEENGEIYEGEWREDKRNGFGRLFLVNGDVIKGEFRDGHCDGRALLLQANGDWYDGYWAMGLREGPGMFCFVQRQQYLLGEWSKNFCKCGTMYDMPNKTTNEHSSFIPRLGLLRDDEILELERRKIYDSRIQEFAALQRGWVNPDIMPPLGACMTASGEEEKCAYLDVDEASDTTGDQVGEPLGLDVE
ncbi:putative kinesin [Trypanosoma theileri]|uniref:MORN repeat-containing protein 3 n=1 Tax=Trypanosoma theileri TaxID=67003 RepID=A0A1X0P6P1_9TRYP|nr:putative kinesin [Trypanosoma theileri]ORC92538.1 putative kinesin [Trypanosoma theileri]